MRWLLAAVTLVITVQIGLALKYRYDLASSDPARPMFAPVRLNRAVAAPASARGPASGVRVPTALPDPTVKVDALKRKYGSDLEPSFTSAGRLASLRGSANGTPAPGAFDPNDSRAVSRRAMEVLQDLKPLLGLDPGSELGRPIIRTSGTVAQVEFQQTVGGVPISPASGMSLDLGSRGEVLGAYAQAWSGVSIENQRTLNAKNARATLEGRWEGGQPVVYVTAGSREGHGAGHHAFEFYSHSERVVLDASSGRVLERRDIRHF